MARSRIKNGGPTRGRFQDYGWRVTNIFDTRVAAQLLGIKAFGLAALLERYFDVRLDK
jgi:ribonuclease D